MHQKLPDDSASRYLSALLLTMPIVANFFSRTVAEYFFDLLILVTIVWCGKNLRGFSWKNLRIPSAFDILWPLFILALIISYLINKTFGEPQIRELLQFLWILGLYCFARNLKVATFPAYSLKTFCVFIVLLSISLIYHFFHFPQEDWRLMGTFTNTNFLSQSYYIVYLYLLGLLFSHIDARRKIDAALLLLAFLALTAVLLLTMNRSIWIASVVVIPLMATLWKRKAGIAALLAIFAILGTMYKMNYRGFATRANLTLTPEETGDITRITLWKTNFHIFKENPIWGIGYYNNTRDIQKYYDKLGLKEGTLDSHAHNEILSFLAGTGIVGTTLFLAFFFYFAYLAWKTLPCIPKEMPIRRGLVLSAFVIQPAFLLTGIADNNFEIHVARNFLIVTWALILYFWSEFRNAPAVKQ